MNYNADDVIKITESFDFFGSYAASKNQIVQIEWIDDSSSSYVIKSLVHYGLESKKKYVERCAVPVEDLDKHSEKLTKEQWLEELYGKYNVKLQAIEDDGYVYLIFHWETGVDLTDHLETIQAFCKAFSYEVIGLTSYTKRHAYFLKKK